MSQAQVKKIVTELGIKLKQDEIRQLSRNFQQMRHMYEQNGKLDEAQIKTIISYMLEEQIEEKQIANEEIELTKLSELLVPLHKKFIETMLNETDEEEPLAKLNKWIESFVEIYKLEHKGNVIHPEKNVTVVKQELDEQPEHVAKEWSELHLQVMKASANVNDCLIHSFLTCVSPIFRTLLRSIDMVKMPGQIRLGDTIAGVFRREILPKLIRLHKSLGLSDSVAQRIIDDLESESQLSDELFGPLSRLFEIIIFVRDRDTLLMKGLIGANGWIGTNTSVLTNKFIIIFNPGQGHYEPVRDFNTNTYIFPYSLIEPRFRNAVSPSYEAPVNKDIIRGRLEKRLINSESELDYITDKLEKLRVLLQGNSSVKSVIRRNIEKLEEDKMILEQIIEQMKKNLRGGTRKSRKSYAKRRTTLRR